MEWVEKHDRYPEGKAVYMVSESTTHHHLSAHTLRLTCTSLACRRAGPRSHRLCSQHDAPAYHRCVWLCVVVLCGAGTVPHPPPSTRVLTSAPVRFPSATPPYSCVVTPSSSEGYAPRRRPSRLGHHVFRVRDCVHHSPVLARAAVARRL